MNGLIPIILLIGFIVVFAYFTNMGQAISDSFKSGSVECPTDQYLYNVTVNGGILLGYCRVDQTGNATGGNFTGNMTGNLNMTYYNITDTDVLFVHNITGRSPIYFGSNIIGSGYNITADNFYGNFNIGVTIPSDNVTGLTNSHKHSANNITSGEFTGSPFSFSTSLGVGAPPTITGLLIQGDVPNTEQLRLNNVDDGLLLGNSITFHTLFNEKARITGGISGITFGTGDPTTARVFISSDGKLGINTTTPNEYLTVNGNASIKGSLSMLNNKIINLATPTATTDATTKSYVDLHGWSIPQANITTGITIPIANVTLATIGSMNITTLNTTTLNVASLSTINRSVITTANITNINITSKIIANNSIGYTYTTSWISLDNGDCLQLVFKLGVLTSATEQACIT